MLIFNPDFKTVSNVFLHLFHSPSGKLVQIEYALAAVAAGGPSVGIKGKFDANKIIDFRAFHFLYSVV